ncbi:DUF6191 domain-containing protein [Actinocrispum sp. NPDC049592]|uniref:DUF6191 domain-containing protein n=1 Tax=Actinocrispum sp. NPDC049592 TaxID=3154835 RepID=UPI00341D8B05
MVMFWVCSLPAIALGISFLALCERAWRRARRVRDTGTGTSLSAASFDEFIAFFYGAKRVELDQRATQSLLRDEETNGAPPNGVDLDAGVVVLGSDSIKMVPQCDR